MNTLTPPGFRGGPLPRDGIVLEKGFITQAVYLKSKSAEQVEDLIGYRRGRLSAGWWLLFLLRLPLAHEFEFMGYSYFSGGVVQGHLPEPPDPRTAEERLRATGHDVDRLKRKVLTDTFRLNGHTRLAKVVPVAAEHGENDYPPGRGIPQWRLRDALPFKVSAFVPPGGVYSGNYT